MDMHTTFQDVLWNIKLDILVKRYKGKKDFSNLLSETMGMSFVSVYVGLSPFFLSVCI